MTCPAKKIRKEPVTYHTGLFAQQPVRYGMSQALFFVLQLLIANNLQYFFKFHLTAKEV